MNQASDWSKAPWEITGEKLTNWRRLIWQQRYIVYKNAILDRNKKDRQQAELDRLRNKRY